MFAGLPKVLNYGNPVNPKAPLNRGLLAWWVQLPQRRGGNRWLDIWKKNHGTLTNTPTWIGSRRPNGYGSFSLTGGSTQYFACGTISNYSLGNTAWTISAWMRPSSFGSGIGPMVAGKASGGNSAGVFTSDATGNQIRAIVVGWSGADAFADGGLNSLILNEWHQYTGTFDGTNVSIYRDGVLLDSVAGDGTPPSALNTVAFQIGSDGTDSITSYIDDVRLIGRCFNASEVRHAYFASKSGYKKELNWISQEWLYGGSQSAAAAERQLFSPKITTGELVKAFDTLFKFY